MESLFGKARSQKCLLALSRLIGSLGAQAAALEMLDSPADAGAAEGLDAGGAVALQYADLVVETDAVGETPPRVSPAVQSIPSQAEALSALGNLGYSPGDAASAVAQAAGEAPDADTASLIRAALKLLAPKG